MKFIHNFNLKTNTHSIPTPGDFLKLFLISSSEQLGAHLHRQEKKKLPKAMRMVSGEAWIQARNPVWTPTSSPSYSWGPADVSGV